MLPDSGPKTEDEVPKTLPLFGTLLNTIGENKINDDDVPTRDDNVTKTYKSSGLTTVMLVMRQFTHIGTVEYKKGPFSSCHYLKGNDINGTLDQAWGWQTKLLNEKLALEIKLGLLANAHAYYEKFEFAKWASG